MVFLSHISPVFYSVALLCSAKKIKSGIKNPYFSLQSKKLNHFNTKKTRKIISSFHVICIQIYNYEILYAKVTNSYNNYSFVWLDCMLLQRFDIVYIV
jgi:hypothetical protein